MKPNPSQRVWHPTVDRASAVTVFVGLALPAFASLSPSAASAQWVEAPGKGWVQLAVYHHDTRDQFGDGGDTEPILNNGHAIATSAFVTAALGVVDGVDVWVQAPYHRLEFTDNGGQRVRSGVGDIRTHLRVAPLRYLGVDLPLAVRAGVKLPVGDFPRDAEIIPLGEGQRDWEVMLELGHSFYPRPLYVMGWVGYRWREAEPERARDLGDEAFFLAAAGGNLGAWGLKLTVEGWDGRPPLLERLRLPHESRKMLHVTPTASYAVGPGAVEAGGRFPLLGTNLPAGTALVLGYFVRIG